MSSGQFKQSLTYTASTSLSSISDAAHRSTIVAKAISDDKNAEEVTSELDFVIEHNVCT